MSPLAPAIVVGIFAAAIVLAFFLDALKVLLFRHLAVV